MRNARGFTLLEVLLAVTIAVILTATMAGTIGVAFRLKKEAEYAVESVHGIEVAGDIWAKEMKGALPPNTNSSADPNAIGATTGATSTGTTGSTSASGGVTTGIPLFTFGAFYGDSQNIQFYNAGPEPKADLQTDVKYVEFGTEQIGSGSLALVRRVNTNILSADSQANMRSNLTEEVLIPNITNLTFQYYDQNYNITDTWDSTQQQTLNALPFAVEMLITLPPFKAGGPDRTIHRFVAIPCAAPVPDTGGITGSGTSGLSGF